MANEPHRYNAYSGDKCKCGVWTHMRSDGVPQCPCCYDAMLAARERVMPDNKAVKDWDVPESERSRDRISELETELAESNIRLDVRHERVAELEEKFETLRVRERESLDDMEETYREMWRVERERAEKAERDLKTLETALKLQGQPCHDCWTNSWAEGKESDEGARQLKDETLWVICQQCQVVEFWRKSRERVEKAEGYVKIHQEAANTAIAERDTALEVLRDILPYLSNYSTGHPAWDVIRRAKEVLPHD